MKKDVETAVKTFNNGGIIIFPTDTAYGIGCRIDDEKAVKRLFEIRRRPEDKAVPVLVSSFEMAEKYWETVPDLVFGKLIKHYWPGALTVILKADKKKVPSLVRGGKDTVGLRMPDNNAVLEIIRRVGVPILAPSANFSGGETPFRLEDLDPELIRLVDYVVRDPSPDAHRDQDDIRREVSTVIDCTADPWKIIREGGVRISTKNKA